MLILGLTGGIACGKSNVSDALADLGAFIVDGDKLSKQLTLPEGKALPLLLSAFGSSCFHEDGTLDRKALASLVFNDDAARKRLDGIMQPLIREDILKEIGHARESGADVCVLDMPLLYEKGLDSLCSRVWVVSIPHETQVSRLTLRDGLTKEEAEKRIRSQMPVTEKAKLADIVIDTSGTVEETRARIPALYRMELDRVSATPADVDQAAASRRRRPSSPRDNTKTEFAAPAVSARPDAHQETSGKNPAPPAVRRRDTTGGLSEKSVIPVTPAQPFSGQVSESSVRKAPPRPAEPVLRSSSNVSSLPEEPGIMERPTAARKGAARRKKQADQEVPSPLRAALFICAAVIAITVASILLMRAYQVQKRQETEYAASRTLDRYPKSSQYSGMIERYAEEFNLDPAFVSAIILNESSYDRYAVSNVGARGLMQLMSDTAEWIAGKLKITDYSFERMFDPETNIRFGCWYLHFLSERFNGDVVCVTCAYHAGQGEVSSWLNDPAMSVDGLTLTLDRLKKGPTRTYAERVTKAYGIYKALYYTEKETPLPAAGAPVPYPG